MSVYVESKKGEKKKTKMTIADFKKYKKEGRKFCYVTAYDYTTATIVNESNVEVILVGDSLGMIMLGYDRTTPVTLEDIIHHTKPVVKGAPDTFIVANIPFGTYNVSIEKAVENATRLYKETGCDWKARRWSRSGRYNNGHSKSRNTSHGAHRPNTSNSKNARWFQGTRYNSRRAKKLIEDVKAIEKAGSLFSSIRVRTKRSS